jgi:hypothetical protein
MIMRRSAEIAEGLIILATVGLLVGAFVIPGQWQAGSIRMEAKVGLGASVICIFFASFMARSLLLPIRALLVTLLLTSVGYLAVTPFVVSETGATSRLGLFVVGLVIAAAASAFGLWLLKRHAAQQAVAADRPKTGPG